MFNLLKSYKISKSSVTFSLFFSWCLCCILLSIHEIYETMLVLTIFCVQLVLCVILQILLNVVFCAWDYHVNGDALNYLRLRVSYVAIVQQVI